MFYRFSKTIWLVLVIAFVVTGCEQADKHAALVYKRFSDPNFVVPGSAASQAIEATGGPEAWAAVEKLEFQGVVTFYQPDDSGIPNTIKDVWKPSFYLTEQHYEINPWSNLIRISTTEPQGKFVWQLSRGKFSVLRGARQVNTLPVRVCERWFAEAILSLITAPVRLLDTEAGFTRSPTPVRIEGLWYHPIRQVGSDTVFYQSRDGFLIDMIQLADVSQQRYLAIRGYDYKEVQKGGILAPVKIEIFQADANGFLQQRLVKIDFY